MSNKHSVANLPSRQISVVVKNIGELDMPVGSCALISYTSNATCLCVWMTATTSLSTLQKVLGPVDFTNIPSGEFGTVRVRGRHTNILGEGTIGEGDILCPHQTIAGAWSCNQTATGAGCIISHGIVLGATKIKRIEGHVVTWRV